MVYDYKKGRQKFGRMKIGKFVNFLGKVKSGKLKCETGGKCIIASEGMDAPADPNWPSQSEFYKKIDRD